MDFLDYYDDYEPLPPPATATTIAAFQDDGGRGGVDLLDHYDNYQPLPPPATTTTIATVQDDGGRGWGNLLEANYSSVTLTRCLFGLIFFLVLYSRFHIPGLLFLV